MAKSWVNNGNKIEKSLNNYFTSNEGAETFAKSVEKLGGEGEWNALHGVRFLVDGDGVILKGPDEFVGRKWKDIKKLDYLDTFNVMRNVSRANQIIDKSMVFDPYGNFGATKYETKDLAEKYREMARTQLDKAISKKDKAENDSKDPLYQTK